VKDRALPYVLLTSFIFLFLSALPSCKQEQSGIYGPCDTSKDCDMSKTDVCVLRDGGWCTILCQHDNDCPVSGSTCAPMGKLRICQPEDKS